MKPDNNARDTAVRALRDQAGNVSAHLDRLLGSGGMSAHDRALAAELTLGCVRRRATLQQVLTTFLAQPRKRIPGALNEILHVALYQILFLDRVPDYAVVDEAVKQAARFHHKRQAGLVNGVLRTVIKTISPAETGPPPVAADVIPIGPQRHRPAGRAVFPEPAVDPVGYLAAAGSLPEELARRWVRRLGFERAVEAATCGNARPPTILRVNRLRSDVDALLAELSSADITARRHANGLSVVLDARGVRLGELAAFQQGLVQPQDPTATDVVLAAEPQPGMSVLDLCAAPGTKTTALAEWMDNRGAVTAVDVSDEKLQKIDDNCRRLGIEIVQPLLAEKLGSLPVESFDRVLVDAPCSNTGVLARRAEARWRFDPQALGRLVKDQQFLLAAGARFVKPGGRLVYSTCSIEDEECGDLAQRLTRNDPRMRLESEKLTLPGGADEPAHWHDGGYVAVFSAR